MVKYTKRKNKKYRLKSQRKVTYPHYSRTKWNINKMIKRGHNCYAYFLDKITKEVTNDCIRKHNIRKNDSRKERLMKIQNRRPCGKPQPGYYAGIEKYPKKQTSCSLLEERVIADNPDIRPISVSNRKIPENTCRSDEYMGAMVVHPNRTYHFYRRDGDGYWSHKPGSLISTKYDASGKKITNPKYADRSYKNFKYTDFCNFYCIPRNSKKRNHALTVRRNNNNHNNHIFRKNTRRIRR